MNAKTLAIAKGLLNKERSFLAKAITLIESNNKAHRQQSSLLLQYIIDYNQRYKDITTIHNEKKQYDNKNNRQTIRIGIAGPPGAGKSTFIEQIGKMFIQQSNRVAVLPIDPSSHINGGSILGDKTRMEILSKSSDAYIRPSPTKCILGGITEYTNDVITLCETAGFNVIIVESVGLGQSEIDLDKVVDMLILIVSPGAGDILQVSKKGIMEAADLVLVNKADGSLIDSARITTSEYKAGISFIREKYQHWKPKVLMISAYKQINLNEVISSIYEFYDILNKTNEISLKRTIQSKQAMLNIFRRQLIVEVEMEKNTQELIDSMNKQIDLGGISPRTAADTIIHTILERKSI